MTKKELKEEVSDLEERISELKDYIDYQQSEYDELEEIKDDLERQVNDLKMKDGINDLEDFIFRLKVNGLYSDKLQDFIDEYLKYYND